MNEEITINGTIYVPKGSKQAKADTFHGMKYCIVRTYSAGVFAGYIEKKKGKEVTIRQARRIWKWSGAASLSQLAVDGTCDPENCRFPCEVDTIEVTEAIEVIECTEVARLSIKSVKIWSQI